MSFREFDVVVRTGYTSSYWSKSHTAGFERFEFSCVLKFPSHLEIFLLIEISYKY